VPIDCEPIAWLDYSRNHQYKSSYDYWSLFPNNRIPDIIVQHAVVWRASDNNDD